MWKNSESFIRDSCWELARLWSLLQMWNKVSYGNVFDWTLASREKGNWTWIKVTHLSPLPDFTGFYNTSKSYKVLGMLIKLCRLCIENKNQLDLSSIKKLVAHYNCLTLSWWIIKLLCTYSRAQSPPVGSLWFSTEGSYWSLPAHALAIFKMPVHLHLNSFSVKSVIFFYGAVRPKN